MIGSTLRPEHEMLLCVARTRGAEGQAERARRLVRAGVDWPLTLIAALDHGVMPLLDRNVDILGPGAAPESFLRDLRALALANRYRNLALTAELVRVLGLFEADGVPAVAFAGTVLAALAYGDTALRQAAPLELLVNRADLDWAARLLRAAGYVWAGGATTAQARHQARRAGLLALTLEPDGVELNLRWRFAPVFVSAGPDPRAALENRRREPFGGRTAPCLDPDDALLALVLHGTVGGWRSLGSICDVAELLASRETWEWPGVIQRAMAEGSGTMFLLGVSLAARLLAAPVAAEVLAAADRDRRVVDLRGRVMRALFGRPGPASAGAAESGLERRALDTPTARLACAWGRAVVPTPADWRWLRLPDGLFPLYWGLRPLRLAWRAAADRWTRPRGRSAPRAGEG